VGLSKPVDWGGGRGVKNHKIPKISETGSTVWWNNNIQKLGTCHFLGGEILLVLSNSFIRSSKEFFCRT